MWWGFERQAIWSEVPWPGTRPFATRLAQSDEGSPGILGMYERAHPWKIRAERKSVSRVAPRRSFALYLIVAQGSK